MPNKSLLSQEEAKVKSWCSLEVTSFSQSPRDRILWILTNNGGKMERSRLRARTGMKYAALNPILDELVWKGRIKLSENSVTLISR